MSSAIASQTVASLWTDPSIAPSAGENRQGLPSDGDVVIIGGGFSGLWTAYYLAKAAPSRAITIIDAEHIGFGASGRNGGWCMGWAEGIDALLHRAETRPIGLRWAKAMHATLSEIEQVVVSEGIDCDFERGGTITAATNPAQYRRLQASTKQMLAWGFDPDDFVWLSPDEAARRVQIKDCLGAQFTPHCAAIHPGKLVRGLASVLRALGVQIVEGTRVLDVGANAIETDHGAVRFQTLIRATEAYTQSMKGHQDLVLPVVSAMVATQPLSNYALDSIGLSDRATFCDGRRVTVYGQRTKDNRIAFGARARYLGSQSIPAQFSWTDPIFSEVEQALFSLLPQLQNQEISHRWGGVLGISPRWHLEVAFDERSQKGHLGGYVGEGVGASNFAARCLVEKMLTRTSEWSDAPFMVECAKRWVPEPIRSVGVAIARGAAERADRTEASGRSSRFWGPVFDALT